MNVLLGVCCWQCYIQAYLSRTWELDFRCSDCNAPVCAWDCHM